MNTVKSWTDRGLAAIGVVALIAIAWFQQYKPEPVTIDVHPIATPVSTPAVVVPAVISPTIAPIDLHSVVVPPKIVAEYVLDQHGNRLPPEAEKQLSGAIAAGNGNFTYVGVPEGATKFLYHSIVISDGTAPQPPPVTTPTKPTTPTTPVNPTTPATPDTTTPAPTTPATPTDIIPAGKMRVIIAYESSDNLNADQISLTSGMNPELLAYLKTHCAKNPANNHPEARFWDRNVVLTSELQSWKDAWTTVKPQLTDDSALPIKQRKPLVELVILNGIEGEIYPVANVAEALTILKKRGGQ